MYFNSIYSKSPKSNKKQLLQVRIQITWNVHLSLQGPQLSKGQAKEGQYLCSKAELSRKGGGWRVWVLGHHHGKERREDGASLPPVPCSLLKTLLLVVHPSNGICSASKDDASEIQLILEQLRGLKVLDTPSWSWKAKYNFLLPPNLTVNSLTWSLPNSINRPLTHILYYMRCILYSLQ